MASLIMSFTSIELQLKQADGYSLVHMPPSNIRNGERLEEEERSGFNASLYFKINRGK